MARNIEIKARISDEASLDERLAQLTLESRDDLRQVDTFFAAPFGRLKLRECNDGTAELIHYHRGDQRDPKLSNYERVAVSDPSGLRTLLARALGIRGTVTKQRLALILGSTRIHIDEVEGLGRFLEIEVVLGADDRIEDGERTAAELLESLRVPPEDLISSAYIDLLEAKTGAE
jgi:predicted adenylyl cyclase CyaB